MCSGSRHKEPQCETKSPVERKTIFTPSMVKGIEEGPDKPGCKTALFYNGREFSILETVRGNWEQAFGATTSGIVYVDKRYLWLVNGCLRYHQSHCTQSWYPFSLELLKWRMRSRLKREWSESDTQSETTRV